MMPRRMLFDRLRDERGVAAITVLLVTMVLSVAGAVVVFSATAELEVGARDRRAEVAFSSSEAGLDLSAANLFREPVFDPGQTERCLDNPLVPPAAGITCEIRVTSPSNGQLVFPTDGSRPFVDYIAVSEAREGRTVTRTLAATYRLAALDIPFGLFVDGNVDLNGTPDLLCISMLVNGTVTSRNKLSTDCDGNNNEFNDPDLGWEFHKNRIRSSPAPNMCAHPSGIQVGCTGVYSNFTIWKKQQQNNPADEIHGNPTNPDPAASDFPNDRDVHQRALDSQGEPIPVVTLPGDEILEPMDALKAIADAQGLYRNFRDGSANEVILQPADLGAPDAEFAKNVVVYIDADAGDTIGWKIDLIPGSDDSELLRTNDAGERVGPDSGLIVVRGGGLRMEDGSEFSGAVFVPEGEFRVLGNVTFTGTIYAKGFAAEGGASTIQLTPEWFSQVPTGLFRVLRTSFQECEPFQQYQAGSPCSAA